MWTCTTDVEGLIGKDGKSCESVSLRVERFVNAPTQKDEHTRGELDNMVQCFLRHARVPPLSMFEPVGEERQHILVLGDRLILNQNSGIIENAGIQVHRHWGCPFISGSTLKGIARLGAAMDADASHGDTVNVFGPEQRGDGLDAAKGLVAFLPAFPVQKPQLVVDIVNCHHAEYYRTGTGPAADDEQPIPNFFLAVEKGAPFLFRLRPTLRGDEAGTRWLDLAVRWLLLGLTEHGVGGKTAAGYGWFMEQPEQTTAFQKKMQAAAKTRREAQQERERHARLSPDEIAAETYARERLPMADPIGELKGRLTALATLPLEEQRLLLILLKGKYRAVWDEMKEHHTKGLSQNEKKRAKNRQFSRAKTVIDVASNIGIDLP